MNSGISTSWIHESIARIVALFSATMWTTVLVSRRKINAKPMPGGARYTTTMTLTRCHSIRIAPNVPAMTVDLWHAEAARPTAVTTPIAVTIPGTRTVEIPAGMRAIPAGMAAIPAEVILAAEMAAEVVVVAAVAVEVA